MPFERAGSGRKKDLVVLGVVFSIVLCAALFLLLAGLVQRGGTREIDSKILTEVRQLASRNDGSGRVWGEESVIAITSLGSLMILVSLSCAVAGALVLTRKYHACVFLLAALTGAALLNYSLKPFFARGRPDVVRHVTRVDSWSFPSGHALISSAVYGTLGAIAANLIRPMPLRIYVVSITLLTPLLIGLTRIYLGVHFPSDVLAGWSVGLLWTLLCWLTIRKFQRRGKVEQPG